MRFSLTVRVACGLALTTGALGVLSTGAAGAAAPARTVQARAAVSSPSAVRPSTADARSATLGAQITPLTAAQLSYDHRHGIVPMRAAASGSSPKLNAIPCEVTCSTIHMSYFDGPVLSQAKVEGVFWGTGNFTSGAGPGGEMPSFYNAIGQSDWWAALTEYNTSPIAGGTNQLIAGVSSIGETTIAPSSGADGSTITDAEIETELAAQLNAGTLPQPALDSTNNVETVYALYFPDNKLVCLAAGQCSNNVFCAYHSSFSYDGLDVPYMVLPADTAGSPEASGCGVQPTLTDDFTSYASHELVESTTDTGIGLDTSPAYAYPAAWADNNPNVGEVMDACDTGDASDSAALPGTSMYVQAMWSNVQKACEFSRPNYLNLSPTVASVPAGVGETYAATTNGPSDVSGASTFSISPAVSGASCTGDVCSATTPGSYTVKATDGALSSDVVELTVTAGECAPGSYSATGLSPCTDAPAGTYVATSGATSATQCAAGTYSATSGATACTPADPGSFVASAGSSGEVACAAGTYSATTSAIACTLADPGSFVAGTGASGEVACPAGALSASSGATSCAPAPAGTYVATPGSTHATPCAPGSYSSTPGATVCTKASPGSDVPLPGASSATKCAAGTFSAASGATACTPAPAGTYVASSGATAPTPCSLGSYNPSTGATACVAAPLNSYVATVGAIAATACPSHTFTLTTGATSKSACLYVAVTTTSLHGGTLYSKSKVAYRATLKARGGTTPYKWSIVKGTLPAGLTLDAKTGVISGKATKVGTFTFTVKVLDKKTMSQGQHSAKASLSITITK
jgi:Putative Ig domain/Tyrosine-protein kinase ephrin type A/B receptor-like